MNYRHYIGIDASKRKAHFCIEGLGPNARREASFPSTAEGIQALLELLGKLEVAPAEALVAIEATGLYHVQWCELLAQEGFPVLALNPLIAKRHYSSENAIRDIKTDKVDAAKLCDLARREGPKLSRFRYRSDPKLFGLKRAIGAYKAQRGALTNLLKAAGDLAAFVFPELGELKLTLKSRGLRELLRRAPTPQRIARTPLQALRKSVGSQAEKLLEKAKGSCAIPDLAESSAAALQELLDAIAALQEHLDRAQQQIERILPKCVSQQDQALLRSIKGFGPKTAPPILAFLPEDVLEQSSKKKAVAKIQALFGFDPRIKESGKWKGKTKISKRGIAIARTALYQASWMAVLNDDPELKPYYYELKKRKSHKEAIVDLMRKQLRRIVAVLKDRRPFQYRIS